MLQLDLNVLSAVVAVISGVLAIISMLLLPTVLKLRKFNQGWDDFMRDWKGEPESPGRDATPGVMERLNKLDGMFSKNPDAALTDTVEHMARTLEEIDARLKKGDARMTRIETRLNDMESSSSSEK